LEFLKSEPGEIRWFRLENKVLQVAEKGLDMALAELVGRPSVEDLTTPSDKAVILDKAVSAFVKLAEKLPHLVGAAQQIQSKLAAARSKFEAKPMTIAEIDEAMNALRRERDKLATTSQGRAETPNH
jgi:hypothetical protein